MRRKNFKPEAIRQTSGVTVYAPIDGILEDFINESISLGLYDSTEEMVRDGLRRLMIERRRHGKENHKEKRTEERRPANNGLG